MTNSSNLIDSLEVYVLNNPDEVKPHWVSHFIVPTANELLIKIKTKDGHSGFGLATSYTEYYSNHQTIFKWLTRFNNWRRSILP